MFVALIVGAASLWDFSGKANSEARSAGRSHTGRGVRALYETGFDASPAERRGADPRLSDWLADAAEASRILGSVPDRGGKPPPRAGFGVESFDAEMRLRERLRREGKLHAEPDVVEDAKDGIESAKDRTWRFVINSGEGTVQ